MSIEIRIDGAQRVEQAIRAVEQAISAAGVGGDAVRGAAETLQAYASRITHRDTGTLGNAHFIDDSNLRSFGIARIFIADILNTKSNVLASTYGVFEHDRGGEHAFYDRALAERGDAARDRAIDQITSAVRAAWQ